MRKLTLIFISSLFIHASFAQSYLEPLNKLKKYLQTGGNFFVKDIEIKDGDLYIYETFEGKYYKVNLKKMGETIGEKSTSRVIMRCIDGANCVYSSNIKSKKNFLDFYAPGDLVRNELPALFNDFITSYDKEFGITPPLIHDPKGCFSGDCVNGYGKFINADSTIYSGNWKNGKREGGGSLTKKDKSILYGNWVNDEFMGKGTIIYPNKDRYEGEIKDELPNGKGVLFYENFNYKDKTTLEGNFINGKINGPGEYYNLILDTKYEKMQESYVGNYKDGLYDGFGIYNKISHFPKAQKKGLDDTIRYEGIWKNGKKEGTGIYLNNHVYEAEEYAGEWKNGLKNGKGICYYKIYDDELKVGKMKAGNTFNGEWLNGNEHIGKLTTNTGFVLYDGGQKERDEYWAEIKKISDQNSKWRDEEWEKGRKEREERAEKNAKNTAACVCSKCGGSGTMSIRSAKIWYSDVYENGKKVGTATNTGWEYEDIKCTRCLGTGKCK